LSAAEAEEVARALASSTRSMTMTQAEAAAAASADPEQHDKAGVRVLARSAGRARRRVLRAARRMASGELAMLLWRTSRLLAVLLNGCPNMRDAVVDERVAPLRRFLLATLDRVVAIPCGVLASCGPMLTMAVQLLLSVASTFRERAAANIRGSLALMSRARAASARRDDDDDDDDEDYGEDYLDAQAREEAEAKARQAAKGKKGATAGEAAEEPSAADYLAVHRFASRLALSQRPLPSAHSPEPPVSPVRARDGSSSDDDEAGGPPGLSRSASRAPPPLASPAPEEEMERLRRSISSMRYGGATTERTRDADHADAAWEHGVAQLLTEFE